MRRLATTALIATASFLATFANAPGGDILRRGSVAGGTPGTPADAAAHGPGGAVRDETAATARDTLARTTRALQDARQAQTSARAAALAASGQQGIARPGQPGVFLPAVPNGLGPGALQPAEGAAPGTPLWQGVELPVAETTADGRIRVNVFQNAALALMHWESFNVGRETHLHFDQSTGGDAANNWTAVNQVDDPSALPSQILGQITAPGQVYILNRNGIVFGGSSQVNLRGLTASSLPLNTNLIERGILNNPDSQFLLTGIAVSAGPNGTPSFTPQAPHPDLGRYGDVVVQAGALIDSPVSEDLIGGRVTLAGPNVHNAGTILTPNGQTILAAGLEIGFAPHRANDPTLRGLDTYIGAVTAPGETAYAGSIFQDGIIEAPRGNITLAGRTIEMNGVLESSTSVSLNGRFDILASFNALANPESSISSGPGHVPFLLRETGTVTFGPGSLTRILPEWNSEERLSATELPLRSQINALGQALYLAPGAAIHAPSADVALNAGVWNFRTLPTPEATFVTGSGQIYLDEGSLISVAGSTGIEVPVDRNILEVEPRGAELADSPLQREGALRGVSIQVDARRTGIYNGLSWIGTPLADVSGFAGLIERSVGELTTAAGNVRLTAGDSVVMRNGATIDVSGGWLQYTGGAMQTSRLISGGRLVDIADATPDVLYQGVYRGFTNVFHPRWGVVESYSHPLSPNGTRFETGYTQGASGGLLRLSAAAMALDGTLAGSTFTGERQRFAPPEPAALTVAFEARNLSIAPAFPIHAPDAPLVTFANGTPAPAPAPFSLDTFGRPAPLEAARRDFVHIDPALFGPAAFGALTVRNHGGNVNVPANARLDGPAGGSLSLTGANVAIDGALTVPGGNISLEAYTVSLAARNFLDAATAKVNPTPDLTRGQITISETATISAGGQLVDDRDRLTNPFGQPAALTGGQVSVRAYDTRVAPGSLLDVSGGARVNPLGHLTFGNAGALTLTGGRDPFIPSVLGGSLDVGGTLLGYGATTPGALNLIGPAWQIGGSEAPAGGSLLDPSFFNNGGFGRFDIAGIGLPAPGTDVYVPGLRITEDTHIRPLAASVRLVDGPGGLTLAPYLPGEAYRAPADLTFRSTGATDPFAQLVLVRGETQLAEGASVTVDSRGRIAFAGNTVALAGRADAPGGTITATASGTYAAVSPDPNRALPTLHLGPEAVLNTAGTTLRLDDPRGRTTGQVLAGGNIALQGNILAEAGALLDASGTSATLDRFVGETTLQPAATGSFLGKPFASATIDSPGGSISMRGEALLLSEATPVARAGGPNAVGGSLNIESGRFYRDGETSTTADINLTLSQNRPAFDPERPVGTGIAAFDSTGAVITGGGRVAADTFLSGGFHNIRLGGNVRFAEDTRLESTGSLRIASSGVLQSAAGVHLAAPHVALGQAFRAPVDPLQSPFWFTQNIPGLGIREYNFAPTHGTGSLEVDARLVDLGTLGLLSLGQAAIRAPGGDIRGNGIVNLAADLVLDAARVHPTTGGTFSLNAFDHSVPSTIRVEGGGHAAAPLTAGGTLNLNAGRIEQQGNLLAPAGAINIGWDGLGTAPVNPVTGAAVPVARAITLSEGSLTSVSATDPNGGTAFTAPYGLILNDIAWIDPRGVDITLGGLPDKTVNLSARDLATVEGSVIDTRGGGDLYAYRWIPGVGGTRDILNSTTSFAVLPAYDALAAPFAPFNPTPLNDDLGGDRGYVNEALRPGDQVTLAASAHLPAGSYILLPARYALLPGAVLVTPVAGTPAGAVDRADGSALVSGFRSDALSGQALAGGLATTFEVAPAEVVRLRAEYADIFANEFLAEAAAARGDAPQRLPVDSGRVVFSATQGMDLRGGLRAGAPQGGLGSLVDINSPLDIFIGDASADVLANALFLNAAVLNDFGAASLLVGGRRATAEALTDVAASSRRVVLDNASEPLTGADIILVAREDLIVADNAAIRSTGATTTPAGALDLNGAGTLLRVANTNEANVTRTNPATGPEARLTIGADAEIAGTHVTLDSSSGTLLDPAARLLGDNMVFNSGRISIVLEDAATTPSTEGLVLSGQALQSVLDSSTNLALLSYSTLDLYGSGSVGDRDFAGLSLSTPAIRSFDTGPDGVTFAASTITLGNSSLAPNGAPPAGAAPAGDLRFEADIIALDDGQVHIVDAARTVLAADSAIILRGSGGIDSVGDLRIQSPAILATAGSDQRLAAQGALAFVSPDATADATARPGLGASLLLEGSTVALDGNIVLPAGRLVARATSGDLTVGAGAPARLDVAGTSETFFDQTRHTPGGEIVLAASTGDVRLADGATLDLSGPNASTPAGSLAIEAPGGVFQNNGTLLATGGAGGDFRLDADRLANPSLAPLDNALNEAGFTASRDFRVRSGDLLVDGEARARNYSAAVDSGDIVVTGTIDASGETGGRIALRASGDVRLEAGARVTAAAETFDSAGKGGHVSLEAGSQINGTFDPTANLVLAEGAAIDLSVEALEADSARRGQFAGTLHLRAPRTAEGTDLAIDPIAADIRGASHIAAEGYTIYDRTNAGGTLTPALLNQIQSDNVAYLGAPSEAGGNAETITARLLGDRADLGAPLVLLTGVEIINRTGDLTLGATNSTTSSDWNLAGLRAGPDAAPGVLTLRASGDLVFFNALSDGFTGDSLWLAGLSAPNAALPANLQSWSYRLTAGADMNGADVGSILAPADLAPAKGTLFLGKNTGAASATGGNTATTASIVANNFQVIRTGTGDIDIAAARNIHLLNQFATIYTAGVAVADPTRVATEGDFFLPQLRNSGLALSQGSLGSVQQNFPVFYGLAGGNVRLEAGESFGRFTRDAVGNLIPDSSRQLPNNWLYRRSHVDNTGNFGAINIGSGFANFNDPAASTTWWVDYSNFFQSVGALGGGHVTLLAGQDVVNFDAVIPTNARAPAGRPDSAAILELGGGDLTVRAGRHIDGGVYYVERGQGTLQAGGDITTNATRSVSLGILASLANPPIEPSESWMPTTLFLGKGAFDVTARGDLLLGPIANTFLLPQSNNNRFWYKTYFSTYAPDSAVRAMSLGGDATLRNNATLTDVASSQSLLQLWLARQHLLSAGSSGGAFFQPWLRLAEDSAEPFANMVTVAPPTLAVTAFTGDLNLAANYNLSPAPLGTLELFSAGAVNALTVTGRSTRISPGSTLVTWGSSRINLSDANPAAIPSVTAPFSYFGLVGGGTTSNNQTRSGFLQPVNRFFTETGAVNSVLQTQQALHAPGLLHRDDPHPAYIYAAGGDLSGLLLYSAKPARIIAERDITDISFYIQNVAADQTSLVSAGRDIVAFNPASDARLLARASGNAVNFGQSNLPGDLQISGPGTFEVIAGRNLDLGIGPSNADGTATGLTSVGNVRNPFLPSRGADIVAGAGLGSPGGLDTSRADVDAFAAAFLDPATAPDANRYLAILADYLGKPDEPAAWAAFEDLAPGPRARAALSVFYYVLRNAGRDFNNPDSPGFGVYDEGFRAVAALFPEDQTWEGNIALTSRQIKTAAGGDLHLFAPGGGLTVGFPVAGARPDQGILTEAGGNIHIFTHESVAVGSSRIFTLRGGNEIIWSSTGDIAAGSASRTVRSAPPTRVIIDPQTGAVQTDLSGLATGGGIGVLQTIPGVPPADVDLIAPAGIIDAGDAGIRVSGSLNIAAVQVLNAGNIQVGGAAAGVPVTTVATPNVGALSGAAASTGAAASGVADTARQQARAAATQDTLPSIVTVEVIGFGGTDPDRDDDNGENSEA